MKHRNKTSVSAAAGVVALLVSMGAPAWADGEEGEVEAVDLLIAAEPAFAENIAPDSAGSTELQGVEATVSGDTITLESADGGFSVKAPAASASSSVTPVLLEDAEALFAIQLDAPDAPTEYDFIVELPANGSFELLANGGIIFTNGSGEYVGGVAPPWAKDVNGNEVPTWFTYNGQTLTQHVGTAALDSSAFPVIADPYMGKWLISAAWVTYQSDPSMYVINATPTQYGRDLGSQGGQAYFSYHLDDLKSRLGSNASKINASITNQFFCHVNYNALGGGATYNLESWRPSHGWNSLPQITTHCNP